MADEPTGDLDKPSAEDVVGLLRRLNTQLGKTIILVTHDPQIAGYAQRTILLDQGRFVSDGRPDAVEEVTA